MNEIYWITRLGVISDICEVITIFGIILTISIIIALPILYAEDCDECVDWIKRKFWKYFAIWMIFVIGNIFIPSQKELMMIYGIGSTIDYIKSNDKAKQLPDKAVDALTKYIEDINKKEKD